MSMLIANKNQNKFLFNFNQNSLLFAQFCVPPLTTLCKQQQLFCLLSLCLHSLHKQQQLLDNYSTDLCNRDLQTTITLFKHTASSHKAD